VRVRLPEGAARRPRNPAPPRRDPIQCPTCGSVRLEAEIAFIGGARYVCNDCGFRGAFVVSGMAAPKAEQRPEDGKP